MYRLNSGMSIELKEMFGRLTSNKNEEESAMQFLNCSYATWDVWCIDRRRGQGNELLAVQILAKDSVAGDGLTVARSQISNIIVIALLLSTLWGDLLRCSSWLGTQSEHLSEARIKAALVVEARFISQQVVYHTTGYENVTSERVTARPWCQRYFFCSSADGGAAVTAAA
jgi:hypothetical protein